MWTYLTNHKVMDIREYKHIFHRLVSYSIYNLDQNSPKWIKSKRCKRKKEEQKMVITMASYALRTPPRVAYAKSPGPIII